MGRRRLESPSRGRRADLHRRVHRPGGGERREGVEKRRVVVAVGEEANGFRGVGDLEEAKRAGGALGDLEQAKENADHAEGQQRQTEQPAFPAVQLDHPQKEGDGRKQGKAGEPCGLGRHADGGPRKLASEQLEGLDHAGPGRRRRPDMRRQRDKLKQGRQRQRQAQAQRPGRRVPRIRRPKPAKGR